MRGVKGGSMDSKSSNGVKELEKLIDVARGVEPADLVLKGAKIFNVFTGKWDQGDLAICGGTIVGCHDTYEGHREIDLSNRWIVPGFIDSHVHVESSCMVPSEYERAVLPRGTTGAIIDPHEIVNVLGIKGFDYFLECAAKSTMDFYVMLSSCVPATTHLETSGARIDVQDLLRYKNHPHVLGLAEMMNFPGLLFKDPTVLEKVAAFKDRRIDGHSPLLRGKDLNAYLSCGIGTCHESVLLEEAQEKLAKGMQILLREGSVAKNLKDLSPILNEITSPKISFCTDDRNPVDIFDEGHIAYLVKRALEFGISEVAVFRAASWSTAQHYGLQKKGALSPGYDADLVVLSDPHAVTVECVFKRGKKIQTVEDIPAMEVKAPAFNSISYHVPALKDFEVHQEDGQLRVIEVVPHQIITKGSKAHFCSQGGVVSSDCERDLLKIAVLERHGHGVPMAMGFVKGFGLKRGALGSSVCHDSHNVVVVGTNDHDMRECFQWMIQSGGGFVAVEGGRVKASLELPVAGLMSERPMQEIYARLRELKLASKQMGCVLDEPFLQLAFLCLPVIPELKITDRGLVDVNRFEIVDLRLQEQNSI